MSLMEEDIMCPECGHGIWAEHNVIAGIMYCASEENCPCTFHIPQGEAE